MDTYIEKMEYCGMLNLKYQAHSPFRDCIEDHQDLAETLYSACRYDVCAYFHDIERRQKIICESLNSLAAECESRGVIVKWRRENFCRMFFLFSWNIIKIVLSLDSPEFFKVIDVKYGYFGRR